MRKKLQTSEFPFKSRLNLSSLVKYWEDNLSSNNVLQSFPKDHILAMINAAPEFKQPIDDLSVLDKHKDVLGFLMSAIIPPALVDSDLAAALLPFNFHGFYATPGYHKVLPLDEIRNDIVSNMKDNNMEKGKVIRACIFILNKFYGTDINFDHPMLVSIPDKASGLSRIYKIDINTDFVDVINKGELRPISPELIRLLLDNIYDTDLWLEYINPDNFEFEGFSICKLVDVTVVEMISSMKYDLLKKDAVACPESFESIQQKIRAIFNLPKISLGLSFFDVNNNIISNHGTSAWNSFMMPTDKESLTCDYFENSVYDLAFNLKRTVVIEDLESMKDKTHVEEKLLASGIKNVVVSPLIYEDEVIGMLELGTPYAGKLNAVNASKMEAVIPMFTAAVQRVLEDMKMEVRAIIQEECTTIHPSVEWRFMEEGYKIISQRTQNKKVTLGEIVFNNVYPIYGLSDIRNSSSERNHAIQQDLRENLKQAKKVIKTISEYSNMPIFDEISFRLDQEISNISKALHSGDESSVLDFLKHEIIPAFNLFKQEGEGNKEVKDAIERYEKLIDPTLGVIYNKRRDFEESFTQINHTISSYLEEVEEEAQQIFPHYFEKYKTDGVEYNIYLGQSLVKDKTFNKLYLSNFRLWQLLTMCVIGTKVDQLKETLPKPLDITQLILVHGEPLSIRFRKDEKRFDVDGAYNIRYEIVKKRIDKAHIEGSNERITQPGKIAIVYAQQKEADEYMRYIKYLQSIGYLTKKVEYLNMEELQGAHGLKVIRVEVNLKANQMDFSNEVIRKAIVEMSVN
jgi:hypothetical protein